MPQETMCWSETEFARHRRNTLVATCTSYILVILDTSVVNVALQSIAQSLNGDISSLQWVVSAYTVVFAALLLTGGALGDMVGARRAYVWGLAIFTGASAICSLAGNLPMLLAGRALQGIGAAILVPCSLALLAHTFSDPNERSRAISVWAACGGVALVLGPVVGGFLVSKFGWPSIFLLNIPLGIVGIVMSRSSPPEHTRDRRIDLLGQILAIVSLSAFMITLIEGPHWRWTSWTTISGASVAIVTLVLFLRVQATSEHPMLPLDLFRIKEFTGVCLVFAFSMFAFAGVLFVTSLYLQTQQHLSPFATGLALLPLSVFVTAGNLSSARLSTKFGSSKILCVGMAMQATGFFLLSIKGPDGGAPEQLAPALSLIGLGGGLGAPTLTSVLVSVVDKTTTGIASGVGNTARQIGAAFGVAVCGVLISTEATVTQGFRSATAVAAALALLNAIVSVVFLKGQDRGERSQPR